MKLSELISVINLKSTQRSIPDIEICAICHDSRRAFSECIFVCKCGSVSDGHVYARSAYDRGARVFVAQKELSLPEDACVLYVDSTDLALAELAQRFYSYPQKRLKIIGITGTKGKTTLALSVYSLGSLYGLSMGYIGTNGVLYGGRHEDTANTTPDVLELQRILCEMAAFGVEYVLLEVSSQALWQERIRGLEFFMTLFTNLYPDHIGGVEHPTFEHYRDCKRALFSAYPSEHCVANADSEHTKYMLSGVPQRKVTLTSATARADLYAENIEIAKKENSLGVEFNCHGSGFSGERIFLPFPGEYSVENALEIIAVCQRLGIGNSFIIKALSELVVSGRFETVSLPKKEGVLFVIDYAHNGASLSAVLGALRLYEPKRIICLFGSVGGRTFERRRGLAEAAQSAADVIIVTSDNPDGEAPESVITDICSYMTECDKPVYRIADRAEAIRFAHEIAKEGDFVLLAGKGHENYQLVSGRKLPFCEREILFDISRRSKGEFRL